MLHFLHRRCRLQRHDDFNNVDDADWYQPLAYPIFASCVGGLINFGLKNENVSKFMMMTETQIWQVNNIRTTKLIIVNIHLDMGNRFQFYMNLALDNSGLPTSCGFLGPGVVGADTFCSSRRISEYTFIETKSSGRSNDHALAPLKNYTYHYWWVSLTKF